MSGLRLFVEFDLYAAEYVIMCENYSRSAPAGPRILRGEPHPDVKYRHSSMAEAETDIEKLNTYFDGLDAKRSPSKKKLRSQGA